MPDRILYRIVETAPPTLRDFSPTAGRRGRLLDVDPDIQRLLEGLSAYATEAQARRNARRFPALGRYIAAVRIPDDSPVRVERTRGPGHYTVWGEPAVLLALVTSVIPV